jgi:hypothetical protein
MKKGAWLLTKNLIAYSFVHAVVDAVYASVIF